MKPVIRWAIDNTPAMNTLLISVLVLGALSLYNLRREVFPEFDLEIILVTVPYPGASPEEVEEGICQKIEEAVGAIDGIKKQTAVAKEGSGSLVLELKTGVDVQKILNEVRSEVDRIPSFPLRAEDPEVKQLTMREAAIQLGVLGPQADGPSAERQLREITERVRDELILREEISQANLVGAKEFQIDVEIPEETLRRYGLTLQHVAEIIRRENVELPGGTIRTLAQEVLVKGDNKGLTGEEIARLPLISLPNGVVLTVGELGTVRDEFTDVTSSTRINGRPAMSISVDATSSEDLLAMTAAVHDYVAKTTLPHGFNLVTYSDRSVDVRDRMNLLSKNGLQGLLLVLLVLAIFLNLRAAFWVALGIPISILGACIMLWYTGQTLNMLTMFAFLMALGIVVDDGIVISENVDSHRQRGKGRIQAAVDGTVEVLPSVVSSVGTTIIAFMPLFFVTGVMGKFIACLPLTMIAMLTISLLESAFILPCHLAHGGHQRQPLRRRQPLVVRVVFWLATPVVWVGRQMFYPFHRLGGVSCWLNEWSNSMLQRAARRFYLPGLRYSLRNPAIVLSVSLVILLLALGLVRGGYVPFNVFPKLDSNTIEANVIYPDGTPAHVTDAATRRLDEAIRQLDAKYSKQGSPILRLTRRSVGYIHASAGVPGLVNASSGSHFGSVVAELQETSRRTVKSDQIIAQWRTVSKQLASGFPGAESVSYQSSMVGPAGKSIEFKLLAKGEHVADLERVVDEVKAKLGKYPAVFDVHDDSRPGKWEFHLSVKDGAVAMGVPLGEVAETVRASYYGEEVMRLQRGRHEVKLMVCYPRDDRRSLAEFDEIRVRANDGVQRPLSELADVKLQRSTSEINRVDQLRAITISADVDESRGNARRIAKDLQQNFLPELLARYPNIRVRWEGQQEQTQESVQSLMVGFVIALIGMFVLLTLEFRSYLQPLLILAIIPFGAVGAVAGHALLNMPLTLFSLFGLVALTGVVVNDSIVLIDFINHRIRDGAPLIDSLLDAGRQRLRAVLLTSITTIAGLLPLLLERSFQAQVIVPMAVSLSFGLILSTLLVLFLVPTFYLLYARVCLRDIVWESQPDVPRELSSKPAKTPKTQSVA